MKSSNCQLLHTKVEVEQTIHTTTAEISQSFSSLSPSPSSSSMHHLHSALFLKAPSPPYHGLSPLSIFYPSPRPFPPPQSSSLYCYSNRCNLIKISASLNSATRANDSRPKTVSGGITKLSDVATLGNLCVDVVLNVPQLPPSTFDGRKEYMENLSASPPDKKFWEAGGNCNMAIAAARLGLNCATIGHVGEEIYGKFLVDVLQNEGITMVRMIEGSDLVCSSSLSYTTLLCWVLVDPLQRHDFCSRVDFTPEPAYSWLTKLSREVKAAIKQSKVLFCNGYGFDELSPDLLAESLEYAIEAGTAVFFDPGPRGKSLSKGTPAEQRTLNQFLKMSDVLLLTYDEAQSLTGIENPIQAGQELLRKAVRTKWVIIKMGAKGSILITTSSISCAPVFKVDVMDTVGCGDSFVAAIAYGYIHNLPMVSTLGLANAVGAATAMGCGAGRNVATLPKVLELIRSSHLIEDDQFWIKLLDQDLNGQEISILSKEGINGSYNQLNHISLQKVVSELLPKLEESTSIKERISSNATQSCQQK